MGQVALGDGIIGRWASFTQQVSLDLLGYPAHKQSLLRPQRLLSRDNLPQKRKERLIKGAWVMRDTPRPIPSPPLHQGSLPRDTLKMPDLMSHPSPVPLGDLTLCQKVSQISQRDRREYFSLAELQVSLQGEIHQCAQSTVKFYGLICPQEGTCLFQRGFKQPHQRGFLQKPLISRGIAPYPQGTLWFWCPTSWDIKPLS